MHRRGAMLVEILPVVDGCLIGAVSLLSGIVWQQRRQLSLLQTDQILLANKLGTIEQQTSLDALTGLRNAAHVRGQSLPATPGHGSVRTDLPHRSRRAEGCERQAGTSHR